LNLTSNPFFDEPTEGPHKAGKAKNKKGDDQVVEQIIKDKNKVKPKKASSKAAKDVKKDKEKFPGPYFYFVSFDPGTAELHEHVPDRQIQ